MNRYRYPTFQRPPYGFPIGARVRYRPDLCINLPNVILRRGTIVKVINDECVHVKFDDEPAIQGLVSVGVLTYE